MFGFYNLFFAFYCIVAASFRVTHGVVIVAYFGNNKPLLLLYYYRLAVFCGSMVTYIGSYTKNSSIRIGV